MYSLAALVIPVAAGAFCFNPPPAEPKKLSYKGNLYRLPLGRGIWSSPQPVAHMLHILLTEQLGYDVDLKGPSLSSRALLEGLAGCPPTSTTCNSTERAAGKFQDPPPLWAAAEVWVTGLEEQRLLKYSNSLGPVGYVSTPSLQTYQRVHQATEASGVFAGFWRSLYRPELVDYFSNVSSMHAAILSLQVPADPFLNMIFNCIGAACIGRVQPGTIDGAPPSNGDLELWAEQGVTLENGWFYAPACKNDTSKCIPVVLANPAWNFLEWSLVAVEQSLPLAITFLGWFGECIAVMNLFPLSHNFLFYWWRPDNTFLNLNPEMMFFKEDIMKIRQFQYSVKVIWPGLRGVDEDLFDFFSRFFVADEDMAAIMQRATGSNWEALACDWLKANNRTWQTWLPDETNCHRGFFYNSNETKCETCKAGTISKERGMTQCVDCPIGFHSSEAGSTSCEACPAGKYNAVNGSRECSFCERGFYGPRAGLSACLPCDAEGVLTTAYIASVDQSACICPAGSYQPFWRPGSELCVTCQTGLICEKGSEEANIPDLGGPPGPGEYPRVMQGYYTLYTAPTSVYQCKNESHCPGGLPETCAGERSGMNCAFCPFGTSHSPDGCKECSSSKVALAAFVLFVCLMIFPVLIYYFSNDVITSQTTNTLGLTVSIGMIVTTLQILGTYQELNLPWPPPISRFFSGFTFLLFDGDSVSLSCIVGNAPLASYLGRFFATFVVVGWFVLYQLLSKLVSFCSPGSQWNINKTINSVGSFMQMAFIAIVSTAVQPLPCYSNPNGTKSSMHFPQLICFSDSTHIMLTSLGILLLVVLIIPFLAISVYASFLLPKLTTRFGGQAPGVVRCRFLLYRFRPDVWWWGPVYLIRQTLLALSPMIQPDDPNVQVIFVVGILSTYLLVMCRMWPWKTHELNILESSSVVLLIMVAVNVGSWLEPSKQPFEHQLSMWFFIVLVLAVNTCVGLYAIGVFLVRGHKGQFGSRYPQNRSLEKFAREWLQLCSYHKGFDSSVILAWLLQMNDYDRKVLDTTVCIAQSYAIGSSRKIISGNCIPRLCTDMSGSAQKWRDDSQDDLKNRTKNIAMHHANISMNPINTTLREV